MTLSKCALCAGILVFCLSPTRGFSNSDEILEQDIRNFFNKDDDLSGPANETNREDIIVLVNSFPITNDEIENTINIFFPEKKPPLLKLLSIKKSIVEQIILNKLRKDFVKDMVSLNKKEIEKELKRHKEFVSRNRRDFKDIEDLFKKLGCKDEESYVNEVLVPALKYYDFFMTRATEDKVKAFYDANIRRFSGKMKMRASHILFKTGKDEKENMRTRQKAEEVLRKVKAGESFSRLAREYSDCSSKTGGGDLDYFSKGTMVKSFEDAAFALAVNEISPLIKTKYGIHIIKVTDITGPKPFDEVKDAVMNAFIRETKTKYDLELIEEADIKIVNENYEELFGRK